MQNENENEQDIEDVHEDESEASPRPQGNQCGVIDEEERNVVINTVLREFRSAYRGLRQLGVELSPEARFSELELLLSRTNLGDQFQAEAERIDQSETAMVQNSTPPDSDDASNHDLDSHGGIPREVVEGGSESNREDEGGSVLGPNPGQQPAATPTLDTSAKARNPVERTTKRVIILDATPQPKSRFARSRRSSLSETDIAAIRQSNGLAGSEGRTFPLPQVSTTGQAKCWNCTSSNGGSVHHGIACPANASVQRPSSANVTAYAIAGRTIRIRKQAPAPSVLVKARTWDKTKRSDLDPDVKQKFVTSAQGYVLSKHNKLRLLSTSYTDGDVLKHVSSLQHQLRQLRAHAYDYDFDDVFTIVVPEDVQNHGDLTQVDGRPQSFDLLSDFGRLHPTVIANSNAWYNLWADHEYVAENMNYAYNFCKNNTEESLFYKCLEDYEEYSPIQQGGPLMLYLVLRKIQNVSETALDHMKAKITKLRISAIPGEDVSEVVSLIKATHSALESASTSDRSYVPLDFAKLILEVLQTSSNKEFNDGFKQIQSLAQLEADRTGGLPEWPTIPELMTTATNTYGRLVSGNKWGKSPKSGGSAFPSHTGDSTPGT